MLTLLNYEMKVCVSVRNIFALMLRSNQWARLYFHIFLFIETEFQRTTKSRIWDMAQGLIRLKRQIKD